MGWKLSNLKEMRRAREKRMLLLRKSQLQQLEKRAKQVEVFLMRMQVGRTTSSQMRDRESKLRGDLARIIAANANREKAIGHQRLELAHEKKVIADLQVKVKEMQ